MARLKFLKENKFKNKLVTLLISNEGGSKKAMSHFDKYLDPSNKIIDRIDVKRGSAYTEVYLKEKCKNKKKK